MIIAVDYDGTLEIQSSNGQRRMNFPLIRHLVISQRQGDIVILWTCREGKRLVDALNGLVSVGFRPNYVNQNAPQAIHALGYDSRKVLADIYIDDKMIAP